MRTFDFNGSGKAIANAVAQTITFNSSDIPANNVVAYHLIFDPTNNAAVDVTSVVLKAGGSPIYSLSGVQLRNFIEATSKANYATADAAQGLTIPLYDLCEPIEELADAQQFPYGQLPTLEVNLGSGSVTGSVVCGWTRSTVAPVFYPRMLSVAHGFPVAAGTNLRMPFNTPTRPGATFRGFSVPTAGLIRAKAVVSGVQLANLAGPARATTSGSMIQEASRSWQGNSVADPIWTLFKNPGPAMQGESYFELDLDGNQAAGGQICIYDRIPQGA